MLRIPSSSSPHTAHYPESKDPENNDPSLLGSSSSKSETFPISPRLLSPYKPNLTSTQYIPPKTGSLETYHRSAKSTIANEFGTRTRIIYDDKDSQTVLVRGANASVGNTANYMHIIEHTEFQQKTHKQDKVSMATGNAKLYEKNLEYRNAMCRYMVQEFKNKHPDAFIHIGHYNEYPCVMVFLNAKKLNALIQLVAQKDKLNVTAIQAFVNLMISFYVGLVNALAYKQKIPIEMLRRASLGFLSPTIAPTAVSLRLNVGIIPKIYADILVQGLEQLNAFFASLETVIGNDNKSFELDASFMPMIYADHRVRVMQAKPTAASFKQGKQVWDIIYSKKTGLLYCLRNNVVQEVPIDEDLAKQLKGSEEDEKKLAAILCSGEVKGYLISQKVYSQAKYANIVHLLFATIKKSPEPTTVEFMMKTYYARQLMSKLVFESYVTAKAPDVNKIFFNSLRSMMQCIQVHGTSLHFKTSNHVQIAKKYKYTFKAKIDDPEFWKVIELIIKASREILKDDPDSVKKLVSTYDQKQLDSDFYYNLERLNHDLFVHANRTRGIGEYDKDGHGSDSEVEEEFEITAPISKKNKKMIQPTKRVKVFGSKVIVHNGMRSILLAIMLAKKMLSVEAAIAPTIDIDHAYYEVVTGLDALKKMQAVAANIPSVAKNLGSSAILLHDANFCVTDGEENKSYFNLEVFPVNYTIIILDTTSTTLKDCHEYIKLFVRSTTAKIMLMVASGNKNQQLGADLNAYGTVRIFTKSFEDRLAIMNAIKNDFKEPGIQSQTSHNYRRLMKRMGAVPENKKILHPDV